MIALKSSGSSLAESAVDPTRSQNRTVSCRRSIGRESSAADTIAEESSRKLVPQSPQKLFVAGFAAPQAGQRRTTAAPHCPQNFCCSGTSAAQFVHCIRTSTEVNINNATTMRQKSSGPCDLAHSSGDPSRCLLWVDIVAKVFLG